VSRTFGKPSPSCSAMVWDSRGAAHPPSILPLKHYTSSTGDAQHLDGLRVQLAGAAAAAAWGASGWAMWDLLFSPSSAAFPAPQDLHGAVQQARGEAAHPRLPGAPGHRRGGRQGVLHLVSFCCTAAVLHSSLAPLDIDGEVRHCSTKLFAFRMCILGGGSQRCIPISAELASRRNVPCRSCAAPKCVPEPSLSQIDVELTKGNKVSIKLKAIGELQPSGMREVSAGGCLVHHRACNACCAGAHGGSNPTLANAAVLEAAPAGSEDAHESPQTRPETAKPICTQVFFEYNGIPRVVEVREESKAASVSKKVRGRLCPSEMHGTGIVSVEVWGGRLRQQEGEMGQHNTSLHYTEISSLHRWAAGATTAFSAGQQQAATTRTFRVPHLRFLTATPIVFHLLPY